VAHSDGLASGVPAMRWCDSRRRRRKRGAHTYGMASGQSRSGPTPTPPGPTPTSQLAIRLCTVPQPQAPGGLARSRGSLEGKAESPEQSSTGVTNRPERTALSPTQKERSRDSAWPRSPTQRHIGNRARLQAFGVFCGTESQRHRESEARRDRALQRSTSYKLSTPSSLSPPESEGTPTLDTSTQRV
jgi:hypothetical protein